MGKKLWAGLLLAGAIAVIPIKGAFWNGIASPVGEVFLSGVVSASSNTNTPAPAPGPAFNATSGVSEEKKAALAVTGISSKNDAEGKLTALKEKLTADDVFKLLMSNDASLISEFETACSSNNAITATTVSAISSAIQDSNGDAYLSNASSVKIVGAGLNEYADDNSKAATLKVAAVGQSDKPAIPEGYGSKVVMLEIKLEGLKTPENLKYPVRITVPAPAGLDRSRLVVLHYNAGGKVDKVLQPVFKDNDMSFCTNSFSTFAFAERKPVSDTGNDDAWITRLENKIAGAEQGATLYWKGIEALSNSMMKALLARKDVTLVLEYTYGGKDYVTTIPAGAAIDDDIPWYGPLYLAARYSNAKPAAAEAAEAATYVVKAGDSMSKIARANHMTLAQLVAKNPQIKNINLIKVGQVINL